MPWHVWLALGCTALWIIIALGQAKASLEAWRAINSNVLYPTYAGSAVIYWFFRFAKEGLSDPVGVLATFVVILLVASQHLLPADTRKGIYPLLMDLVEAPFLLLSLYFLGIAEPNPTVLGNSVGLWTFYLVMASLMLLWEVNRAHEWADFGRLDKRPSVWVLFPHLLRIIAVAALAVGWWKGADGLTASLLWAVLFMWLIWEQIIGTAGAEKVFDGPKSKYEAGRRLAVEQSRTAGTAAPPGTVGSGSVPPPANTTS